MLNKLKHFVRNAIVSKRRRNEFGRALRVEHLEQRKMFAVALINEFGADLPSNDQPFEYVEIKGIPGSTLQDVYFVSFEGDGTPGTGLADLVVNLSDESFGENGLMVIKAASGGYTPAAETTVIGLASFTTGGPLENGTISNVLIYSPTTPISAGTDYDSDNDGNLTNNPTTNLPADAVILDSVGWSDGNAGDRVYGTSLGSQTNRGVAVRFLDDNRNNNASSWYWGTLTGSQGSTTFGTSVSPNFPVGGAATPGRINVPGTNVAPVATTDSYDVGQSETLVVSAGSGVLSNDTDGNGLNQLLFAELVSGPANASSFSFAEDGSFTYVNNGTLGADTFTYRATDLQTFSSIVTVTVNGIVNNNAAPVLTVPTETVAYVENAVPLVITTLGTITDSDSTDFGNGSLTAQVITDASTNDRLWVRNQGSAAGQIGNAGGVISYEGITIGLATGGIGSTALTIDLNSSATVAAVQALLRNITFENISDAPSTLDRVVEFKAIDGDGGAAGGISNSATQTVTVAGVNDAPALLGTRNSFTYSANSNIAVTLDGSVVVTDLDLVDFNNGVLSATITTNQIAADDSLIVRSTGNGAGEVGVSGSTVSFGGVAVGVLAGGTNGVALTVTFNASANKDAVQAVARSIAFQTTSPRQTPLPRTIDVSLTDGDGGTSNSLSFTVTQNHIRNFAFQEGVDAGQGLYVGAGDVQLFQGQANTHIPAGVLPATEGLLVDYDGGSVNSAVLLRYDGLVGTGPGQIPPNATILSARLIVNTLNAGDGGTIHRMLIDWNPNTATWNSVPPTGTPPIRNNGSTARAAWDSQVGGPTGGGDTAAGSTVIGVAADIQAWVNGETNFGWLFQGHNLQADGWGFAASESPNPNARPRLEVEWVPATTAATSFQQGVNSYTGTVDTALTNATPDTNNSASASVMFVDFTDATADPPNNSHVVMRFDNIIGSGANQVPAGALIHGAYLTFASIDNNGAGDGGEFFPLLQEWPDSPTWNGFVGGIQNNGIEAAVTATTAAGNATRFPNVEGGWNTFNVTPDVQNWTSGAAANNGWGIVPWNLGTDGWGIKPSESTDVRTRPRLQVAYTPVGVNVTPTSGLTTSEDGDSASFSVVLATPPTADVTIQLSSSDTSEGTITITQLVFTPSNWDVPQSIVVTGADDAISDGNIAYQIVTTAVSTDVNYNGLNVTDVSLINNDNDTLATPTITITSGNAVYNNAAYSATAVVTNFNLPDPTSSLSFAYFSDINGTVPISAPIDVGTYYVQASTVANAGNNAAQSSITAFSITQFNLTATGTAANKIYDGTTSATVSISLTGVFGGDAVSGSASGTFDSKNVGIGKTVTIGSVSLTGADAGNYSVGSAPNTTADITAKALTASATAANKVYDGNTSAVVTVSLAGVIGSEVVNATAAGTFDSKNVGNGRTVTVGTVNLAGADAGNYTVGAAPNTTADITVKALTVTAAASSKPYDGNTSSSGVPVLSTPLVGSDTGTFTQSYASAFVGTGKTLIPTASINDGNGGANYAVTLANANNGVITTSALVPSSSKPVVNGGLVFSNPKQRSQVTQFTVNFNVPVIVTPSSFTFENLGLLTATSPIVLGASLDISGSGTNTITIRFNTGAGVVTRNGLGGTAGNSLADGHWRITINAGSVTDTAGQPMISSPKYGNSSTDEFFRMFGDSDGDGDVDATDVRVLRSAMSAYNPIFDANGDGFVNSSDSAAFNSNYGKRRRIF